MTNIRRYYDDSYTYFVTNVTYERQRILLDHTESLKQSIDKVKSETSFDLVAWVILPEHFHIIVRPGTINISLLMRRIKLSFSAKYRKLLKMSSGQLWQNRFYDHVIRNQDDMNKHLDYIHFNPVKHGLVSKPFDYRYSSIHDYRDYYSDDWGIKEDIDTTGDYGE
jgi:putative transposase